MLSRCADLYVDGACASVRIRLLLIAIAGLRPSLCTLSGPAIGEWFP